jgi:hypothetical protein
MTPGRLTLAGTAPLLAALAVFASGCKAPQAFGERHSLIVRADSALWQQVDSAVLATLEERFFTTRPERIFKVTFVASGDTLWDEFRLWQQVLVLGPRGDEVVERVLRAAGERDAEPPAVIEAKDIWALEQIVTLILLPEQGQAEAVREKLPEAYDLLRARYDEWIRNRMYISGVNDSLKQALAQVGFTLDLPRVYLHFQRDSVFRFGNPYRQAETDILRSLLVTWTAGIEEPTPASLRAWRDRIDETEYQEPQDILDVGFRSRPVTVNGVEGVEIRGVWQDRSDFPAAGPFISRALPCPAQNRTYYLDAWLFAPGEAKYPYLRQLEILMDTFRCTGEPATAGDGEAGPADPAAG